MPLSSRRPCSGAAAAPPLTSEVADRLALNFGVDLTKIVPGRVSTEVDADLSFDVEGPSPRRAR